MTFRYEIKYKKKKNGILDDKRSSIWRAVPVKE